MICKIIDKKTNETLRIFAGNFELIYESQNEIKIVCCGRKFKYTNIKEINENTNGTIIYILI